MSSADIPALGQTLREELERLKVGPDSFLPEKAVQMQRSLACLSDDQLRHVIVAAAVQSAARQLGTITPGDVLRSAAEKVARLAGVNWTDKTAPEVRRITEQARNRTADGAALDSLIDWASGELIELSREVRMPRPVHAPTLAEALRLIAERLETRAAPS